LDSTYHKLLQRQIRKTLGEKYQITPELEQLFQHVSDTYIQADEDHALVERSLEISSQELSDINKSIEQKVNLRTEELRQEHVRFMSSINSLGVGFMMCDGGSISMMNPAMQHILAAATSSAGSESEPKTVRTDWTLDEVDGILRPSFRLKEALHESLESDQKVEFKKVDLGTKILHLFLAPILPSEQSDQTLGVVVLVEDVTEQTIAERSRDEFFTIASHELRTPLTAIQGNAAIIRKYYPKLLTDPPLAEIISDIHESAVRLIQIVNDFLDVSALEQGKMPLSPTTLRLNDLMTAVRRDLEGICSAKGLALNVDPAFGEVPPVTGDEARIKQVIYNLVGNALKFTEKGSITIKASADEHFVHISVTDTGRGMSADDQRLLFHKFQQAGSSLLTRDTPKGTGLGLYISKLIIERSGGTIGLEHSEVGKGSSFGFSLPRAATALEGVTK